jgi:L-asparaginase II
VTTAPTHPTRPVLASTGSSSRGTSAAHQARGRAGAARPRSSVVPPVLVRQVREGIVESEHRGHVVEVDLAGRPIRSLGDPDHVVTLRSAVKPFGLVALIEAGAVEAFELTAPEIAIMASSHSGEDLHVRTLQDIHRRARVSQAVLACGAEGMPLDALTAARLARDGEKAGPIRHMCSGQHTAIILLARLRGWDVETYWQDDHPAMALYHSAVGRAFGVAPERLRSAIDGCGIPTYALPLRLVARGYAFLADPAAIPADDPRSAVAPALQTIRDAMLAHPEMVAGSRDRLDTSVMKAEPGRLVSKGGMEALRGIAILPGPRGEHGERDAAAASGLAIKIEDGDGYERGTWAATIESLRQAGALTSAALRQLARYHHPPMFDPHGRLAAEAIPEFELAPVGELAG